MIAIENTTNVEQAILNPSTNEAIICSPGGSVIIDEDYVKDHSYLYSSYIRKGLKVVNCSSEEVELEVNKIEDNSVKDSGDSLTAVVDEPEPEPTQPKRKRKSKSNSEEVISSESGE